jgi:hypothetical protein
VIGGILAGVLPFLREQADSMMLDACTVSRPAGTVTDPVTGNVTPSSTLIYEGKCKVQGTESQASNPVAGGHAFTVEDLEWQAPIGAGPFEINDVIIHTAAPLDPHLVGTTYRVTSLARKTAKTAQRFRVEVIGA